MQLNEDPPMTTLSSTRLSATAALFLALGLAVAPGAAAQGDGPHFRAQLAAPSAEARAVAGGVVWRCAETSCTAPRTGGRPLRMCRELKDAVGQQIVSFEVAGAALSTEDLARCNS
jgi:hypothetical protein